MKIYQVGGSIRDNLLGFTSKDIDYAVETDSFETMKRTLLSRGFTIFLEKPEFMTVRARNPKTRLTLDFTICRIDGFYSNNRHPDKVEIGTIYDDLKRRDFTVNAIAIDENGKYLDPHGGKDDLAAGILRCVGNANERIREDALRILRAFRFMITKGLHFDDELDKALHQPELINLLRKIPVERKMEELNKMMKYNTVETIKVLQKYSELLLPAIFTDGLWLMPTIKKITKY